MKSTTQSYLRRVVVNHTLDTHSPYEPRTNLSTIANALSRCSRNGRSEANDARDDGLTVGVVQAAREKRQRHDARSTSDRLRLSMRRRLRCGRCRSPAVSKREFDPLRPPSRPRHYYHYARYVARLPLPYQPFDRRDMAPTRAPSKMTELSRSGMRVNKLARPTNSSRVIKTKRVNNI